MRTPQQRSHDDNGRQTMAARRNRTAAYCRYRSVIAAHASRVLACAYNWELGRSSGYANDTNVPDERIARIRRAATRNGRTIEQEVRELLITQYSCKEAATDSTPHGTACNYSGDD